MVEQQLRWLHLDIECIIRMIGAGYVSLLKNPDFKHEDFLLTGGFPMLSVYKSLIDGVKNTGSIMETSEWMEHHDKIQKIYYKRWGMECD